MNRIHIRIHRHTLVLGALSLAALIGGGGVATASVLDGMNSASSFVEQARSSAVRTAALVITQEEVEVQEVVPVTPYVPVVPVEEPVPVVVPVPVEEVVPVEPAAAVEEPDPAAPAAPAAPSTAWSTYVGNSGDQAAINACTGGLTDWSVWDEISLDGVYYNVHNNCGGMPILTLNNGDLVDIGDQHYVVANSTAIPYPSYDGPGLKDVPDWTPVWAGVTAMNGDAYVQTCYLDHAQGMRVVALKKI